MKFFKSAILLFLFISVAGSAQQPAASQHDVVVDAKGILRWRQSNQEVKLFGVNYTTPFAYSYRAQKKLGLSLKQAIDLDVAQMVRLGFDAFRVHVWDREISDSSGNLLANEHLELLDYLLWKLEQNNIKIILTPIAWWGNGWPEPDETAPGFSQSYSKLQLITDSTARAAERNYLKQFVGHVNPFTKFNYGNDPFVIAMEIINEPHHPEKGDEVTGYINEMVKVVRETGYTKPLFYNISQNWNDAQAGAVCDADVQGVSFQWYPTDLVHNKMLKGNYLPNVNHYAIPSEKIAGYNTKAKMVYEFEAADIGASYMYPAMARSFREAGMQFAAMFSYEPTQIAWSNTEYPTHFLNLLYTPSKAISLMIAGRAFHEIPLMKSYGEYPANNTFDNFRVNYDEDLSVENSDTCFFTANSTDEIPKNNSALKHVAGCGTSGIVTYDGTGAYFLDKAQNGIWKLEVYPDVLWLRDPFEPTSLKRQVARLYWNERKMAVSLHDLGGKFFLIKKNEKKIVTDKISGTSFKIKPGIYLLSSKNVDDKSAKKFLEGSEVFLAGLYTPKVENVPVAVVNQTNKKQMTSAQVSFKFQIATEKEIVSAEIFIKRFGWRGFMKFPLTKKEGFTFSFDDVEKKLSGGEYQFCVRVKTENKEFTFPGALIGSPDDWDYKSDDLWSVVVTQPGENIALFDPQSDRSDFIFPHFSRNMKYDVAYKNGFNGEGISLTVKVSYSGENETPFGMQLNVEEKIKSLCPEENEYHSIVLNAASAHDSVSVIRLNLITKTGEIFSASIELKKERREINIPLSQFIISDALVLPAAYPLFLPKTFASTGNNKNVKLNPSLISALQIVCEEKRNAQTQTKYETGFEIHSIYLTNRK